VTVQNLIPQALGTADGVTVHANGVRVFFNEGPVSNNPSGPASVANPDGTAFFLAAGQPYFQWNQLLAPNETSSPRTWKIQFSPGSTSVTFRVYVAAEVQFENGWIDVTPAVDTILPGDTLPLAATAYDRVGRTAPVSQAFTWSVGGGDGVVAVNASTGEVTTTGGTGTDTVQVSNGTQTGFAVITVNTPLVVDDVTYPALGNVTLPVTSEFGLVNFVSDPDGDPVSVIPATDAATAGGGEITILADGSFTYRPLAGFTGTDTYVYSATDGTVIGFGDADAGGGGVVLVRPCGVDGRRDAVGPGDAEGGGNGIDGG
jgi:hypothetical protein